MPPPVDCQFRSGTRFRRVTHATIDFEHPPPQSIPPNPCNLLARHTLRFVTQAQSTTLTPPEPTNIFAAAGAENRIGAHPLDMAPDARASDGGEMDNPTQRVGAGGVDGMGIGAAEPHPPSTTLVHVKLAEPPSVWNLPNVITMARVVAIPVSGGFNGVSSLLFSSGWAEVCWALCT